MPVKVQSLQPLELTIPNYGHTGL